MSKSNSLGPTLLVTTVLALGIAAAWQYAVQWLSSLVENHQPSTMEQLALDLDGQPLIKRYSRVGRYGGFQAEQVLTLSGDSLPAHPDAVFDGQYIEGGDRYIPDPPFQWWQRLAGVNDGGTPPIYWYLFHDGRLPGRVYGIGFHSKTKTIIGYVARNGFSHSAPPRDEWFHVNGPLQSLTTAN